MMPSQTRETAMNLANCWRTRGNLKSKVNGNLYETQLLKCSPNSCGKNTKPHYTWAKTIPVIVHRHNLDMLIRFQDNFGIRYEAFLTAHDLVNMDRFSIPCDANGTLLGTGINYRYIKQLGIEQKTA